MRSFLTKLMQSLRFIVVFSLIIGWVFSGWPTVPFLNFPSKIQQAAAAVSYVEAGTIDVDATTACTITPGPPTHTTNDILIAVAWNEGGSAITTATAGWTKIADGAGTNDATWWWARAAGAGTAGPDFTAADTDCYGIVYAIRGAVTTGTPYVDATTSGDGGTLDTTPDTATITTTNINQMVFSFMAESDNIAFASGNPPTDWSADSNVAEGTGTDASFHVISKTAATAGDVNSVVIGTFAAGKAYFALTLAFKPVISANLSHNINNEKDLRIAGEAITLTLTNDNWVADGATFDAERQNIIDGMDSNQAEATGWDALVKAGEAVESVVRTSATVVTVTLSAYATYQISASESITVTIPATAVVGGSAITVTPTLGINVMNFIQNTYRWYVDNNIADPTEVWGTPDIAEDTAITIIPAGKDPPSAAQELRLRINFTVNGSGSLAAGAQQFEIEFKAGTDGSCTTGSWTDVGATAASAWQFATSGESDGADITAVLSDTTAGKGEEYAKSNPTQANHVLTNGTQTMEYDFHIIGSGTDFATATQYSFRIVEPDEAVLQTYATCPTLTTEPGPGDLMRHGNVFASGTEQGFFWAD